MGLIDSIIGVESGGDPNATNPRSSASGLGQFIDSTWLATVRSTRPDLAGQSDAALLALKTDPQLSREMTEAYANQNQAFLTKAGVPVTPGSTYLAHFAGPGGAVKVLQADPTASVESILGAGAVSANPFLRGMSAADLQAWADRKMGGGQTPKPASPVASAIMGQQPAPMTSAAIASQLMGAAPQRTAQPQAGAEQQLSDPTMTAMPIQFAQRRSPDLSKLKALFGTFNVRG